MCVGVEQVKVSTYGYVLIAANQHGFSQPSEVVSAAAAHCTLHCTVLARTVHTVPSCPVLSCNVQRGREYSTALRSILSLASMPGHPRTVPYRTQPSPPRPLV